MFCLFFKDINQLKELTDQELVDYVLTLKEDIPEMKVQFLEGQDNIQQDEYEYTLQDIQKYLSFNKEKHIMICPTVDEREHDIFQKIVFSTKDKKDRFPSSKFLNLVTGTVQNELLGISVFVFGYYKITRKFSDFRFINKNRVQEQQELYLYNFESKTFDHINVKEKNSTKVDDYNNRLEVVKYIKKRLKKLDFLYLEALDKILFYKRKNNSKEDIFHYLEDMKIFLTEAFPQGMLVKKLFFNITSEEYEAILVESQNILKEIEKLQHELSEIADDTIFKTEEVTYFTKVKKFFKTKDEKSVQSKAGFFVYKEAEFPNAAEIEKRNYLTDNPANELQQIILIDDDLKLQEEIERIFTSEELEIIDELVSSSPDITHFKLGFFELVKPKKLPSEKRSQYSQYFYPTEESE